EQLELLRRRPGRKDGLAVRGRARDRRHLVDGRAGRGRQDAVLHGQQGRGLRREPRGWRVAVAVPGLRLDLQLADAGQARHAVHGQQRRARVRHRLARRPEAVRLVRRRPADLDRAGGPPGRHAGRGRPDGARDGVGVEHDGERGPPYAEWTSTECQPAPPSGWGRLNGSSWRAPEPSVARETSVSWAPGWIVNLPNQRTQLSVPTGFSTSSATCQLLPPSALYSTFAMPRSPA